MTKMDVDQRREIRDIAAKTIFKDKGGVNFKSLNGKDIETLFNLYDRIFFDGEISERIAKLPIELQFRATKRMSGVGGITGYEGGDPPVLYIDIAPNIINTIFRSSEAGLPFAAGVKDGCVNRLECLLLIMEHQIVHLIMILWGYSSEVTLGKSKKTLPDQTFGPHGDLFQCLIKRLFGHTRFDHDLGLTDISASPPKNVYFEASRIAATPKKRVKIMAVYQNWSYSCYLDSVLIIMFYGASDFWRRVILGPKAKGPDKSLALELKEQLLTDYNSLTEEGKTIMCSTLRKTLLKKEPGLKGRLSWKMYNAGAAYEIMTSILTDLLIDIPVQIYRAVGKGKYRPDTVKYVKEAMFTFWDYMDPLDNVEEGSDYKVIRWDLIQSPVIVFTNGGIPRIRKLNSRKREVIKGEDGESIKIRKARAFGMTIIDNRYELIGVVMLSGVKKEGGGSHYTSYFKGEGDGGDNSGVDNSTPWYYYNDMGPELKTVKELPKKVWRDKKGLMPSMYFYRKVSSVPVESRFVFEPKSDTEATPETPKLETPKILSNKDIEYRRIDRPDDHTLIAIKDKTFAKKLIGRFDNIVKIGPTKSGKIVTKTKMDQGVTSWRIPTKMMDRVEKNIAKIIKETNSGK